MARLLVVDDEQDITDVLVRYLQRAGHTVLAADSAPVALDLVDRHGVPDAAILDVDMPGMDGFELLERLRRRCTGLPALFVTVLWSGDVHARIQQVGAAYLAKPCDPTALRHQVERMLTGDRAEAPRSDS